MGLSFFLKRNDSERLADSFSSGPGLFPISLKSHFQMDQKQLQHFAFLKTKEVKEEDIMSSFRPLGLSELMKLCKKENPERWFKEYYLRDNNYGYNILDQIDYENYEGLKILKAPSVKRFIHIYGVNVNTQVKYLVIILLFLFYITIFIFFKLFL